MLLCTTKDPGRRGIALKSYCQPHKWCAMVKPILSTMKLLNACLLHSVIVIGALLASPVESVAAKSTTGSDQSGDPGWPREKYSNGTRLIIY